MKSEKKREKPKALEPIVIDQEKGLIFKTEKDLYDYFKPEIEKLESEFFSLRDSDDIPEKEFRQFEGELERAVEDPDEVWLDETTLPGRNVAIYLRLLDEDPYVTYIVISYLFANTASFIYLHFPTRSNDLVDNYRRGERIFERSSFKQIQLGAIEGDALGEGESLAVGLYQAMLQLRSSKDIPEEKFQELAPYREETIQDPDEIWRSTDLQGNVLVTFIKEFSDSGDPELHYLVVTVEDGLAGSHTLLFSFPSNDRNLIERYRHGENLQAEEVVQESSH